MSLIGKAMAYGVGSMWDHHEAKVEKRKEAAAEASGAPMQGDTLNCTHRAGRDAVIGAAVGHMLFGRIGTIAGGAIGYHHGGKVCD